MLREMVALRHCSRTRGLALLEGFLHTLETLGEKTAITSLFSIKFSNCSMHVIAQVVRGIASLKVLLAKKM